MDKGSSANDDATPLASEERIDQICLRFERPQRGVARRVSQNRRSGESRGSGMGRQAGLFPSSPDPGGRSAARTPAWSVVGRLRICKDHRIPADDVGRRASRTAQPPTWARRLESRLHGPCSSWAWKSRRLCRSRCGCSTSRWSPTSADSGPRRWSPGTGCWLAVFAAGTGGAPKLL